MLPLDNLMGLEALGDELRQMQWERIAGLGRSVFSGHVSYWLFCYS